MDVIKENLNVYKKSKLVVRNIQGVSKKEMGHLLNLTQTSSLL